MCRGRWGSKGHVGVSVLLLIGTVKAAQVAVLVKIRSRKVKMRRARVAVQADG